MKTVDGLEIHALADVDCNICYQLYENGADDFDYAYNGAEIKVLKNGADITESIDEKIRNEYLKDFENNFYDYAEKNSFEEEMEEEYNLHLN